MTIFLAIQNTYTHVQMSLMQDDTVLATRQLSKLEASKKCIPALVQLVVDGQIDVNDIAFIAVNQGPGPFTTLRVVISTVNGLSFARKIPLIGINALEAFLQEYSQEEYPALAVLLNAFAHDLYYGIKIKNTYFQFGCSSRQTVLLEITQKIPDQPILFLGNGIDQSRNEIQNLFATRAQFLSPNPETASLEQIARMGLQFWKKQENISYQLQPIYLKAAFPI